MRVETEMLFAFCSCCHWAGALLPLFSNPIFPSEKKFQPRVCQQIPSHMEVAPQRTQKWTESYFRKRLVVLSNKKSNIVLELQDFLDSGLQNVGHFLDFLDTFVQTIWQILWPIYFYSFLFFHFIFEWKFKMYFSLFSYLNGSVNCNLRNVAPERHLFCATS